MYNGISAVQKSCSAEIEDLTISQSEEEKVTEKALFEGKADGAIIIADSISLERSLYMALQI